jgi:integrase
MALPDCGRRDGNKERRGDKKNFKSLTLQAFAGNIADGKKAAKTPKFGVAKENESRTAVPFDVVEKTLPFLLPLYQAIVHLLMATRARPIEIFRMRVCDIDKIPA